MTYKIKGTVDSIVWVVFAHQASSTLPAQFRKRPLLYSFYEPIFKVNCGFSHGSITEVQQVGIPLR